VVAVVGVAPLWQPLVAGPYGREQAFDQAWDPARSEWFGVFDPAPAPGTWGHWTGRGMTANSQCAPCHDTHVDRGWDDASATYTTTVSERGVGCEACHGRASAHAADPKVPVPTVSPSTESCLPCHSRRTALTASSDAPGAGETFLDRFRPVGLDDTSAFWPDGQVRDEVFEGESFLSSRMAAVGVRCVDCHDAHTGRTVREGDALCLGCHDRLPGFVRHDHHAEGSEGARCTACHMPTKVFMQRDVRHDHGFTIPDPGLGVEAGVPDACTSCHKDRDPAWAAAALEAWFGNTLRPSAVRARAFVRAETDPADLVAVAAADDHPWWRARALARLGAAGGDAQRAAFFDPAAIWRRRRGPPPGMARSAARSATPCGRCGWPLLGACGGRSTRTSRSRSPCGPTSRRTRTSPRRPSSSAVGGWNGVGRTLRAPRWSGRWRGTERAWKPACTARSPPCASATPASRARSWRP
jgi:predicted CXXCH cytochrome family protein